MKILPLALVLITTPALAQVSTPVLRKGAEKPKASWTPSATPAPSPTKPAAQATSRRARPVVKPKQAATPADAQSITAEASKPKKRGGFFGFFARIFGGGKEKPATADTAAGATASPEASSQTARQSAANSRPGVVADSGSSIRPNLRGTKRGTTSSITPSLASDREKNADRSATIPPTVQNAKPDSANVRLVRPALSKPASGEPSAINPALKPTNASEPSLIKPALKPTSASGPSSIKPALKPSSDGSEPSSIIPPVSPKSTPRATSALPGTSTETATEFDKARYGKVKREAAADPSIVQLAEKLNATPPGAAYKKAARNYVNSLFAKMREIDPSQQEWIDRMEGATIRRIDAGKAFVAE